MALASATAPTLALVAPLVALLGGLAATPARSAPGDAAVHPWLGGRIGVQVQGLTPELREHFSAPQDRGILVARVEEGRPAHRAGVRVGDVLVEAGGEPLRHSSDLLRIVTTAPAGEPLELRLLRKGKARTLSVEPESTPHAALPPGAWEGWERWFEPGLRHGSRALRERLDELEDRLEDLERRLEAGDARPEPT